MPQKQQALYNKIMKTIGNRIWNIYTYIMYKQMQMLDEKNEKIFSGKDQSYDNKSCSFKSLKYIR